MDNKVQQAGHRVLVQPLFETGGHDRIVNGFQVFKIGSLDDVLDIRRVFESDRSLIFTRDEAPD